MRTVTLLLFCLALSSMAQAADIRSAQGIYTGDHPLAPYSGSEPFQFEAMLNGDAGEFCLSMTKEKAKTFCYSITAGADGRYELNDGDDMAGLNVQDPQHIMYMKQLPSGILAVALTRKGSLPPNLEINTGASLKDLAGTWRVDRSSTSPEKYAKLSMQGMTLVVDSSGTAIIHDETQGQKWGYILTREKQLPGRFVLKGKGGTVEIRAHRNKSITMGNVKDRGLRSGVIRFIRDGKNK